MRQLDVYFNNTKAGVLTEQNPDAEYLNSEMPPISVTLPKRKEIFIANKLFSFFSNMLPEGVNRNAICHSLKIDEEDFFGLLTAMANKDFIGAVNIRRTNIFEL